MSFYSINYIFLFLPVVFTVYFLLNKRNFYKAARIFLIISSLFFCGLYKWSYVGVLLFSVLFNYGLIKLFDKYFQNKKTILISGIVINLLVLFFFRNFNGIAEFFTNIVSHNFTAYKVLLPLGISFFTIQQIAFLIDYYKGKVKDLNFTDYFLFVCFFPKIAAGPIVRYCEIVPQFNKPSSRIINNKNISIGLCLFTIGLLKKTIFSAEFEPFSEYVLSNNLYNEFFIAWFLGIFKVLQIYFDFSGYCDMAIGSAFLFNVSMPWNFNSPFRVQSITEHWHKWNMTLMRFLKDYIYKPLGGNKISEIRTYINILIVFVVMGIWNKLSLAHILYGLVNGLFICINKLWTKLNIKMHKVLATSLTFLSIVLASQFLVSEDLNKSITLLKTMFGINASFDNVFHINNFNLVFSMPPYYLNINLVIVLLSFIIIFCFKNSNQIAKIYAEKDNLFLNFVLAVVFVISLLSITKTSDFVYFLF